MQIVFFPIDLDERIVFSETHTLTTSGAPTPKRPPSDPRNMVVTVNCFCLEGDVVFCINFIRCPRKRDDDDKDDDDCAKEKADTVVVKRMTNPITIAGTIRDERVIIVIVIVIVVVGELQLYSERLSSLTCEQSRVEERGYGME